MCLSLFEGGARDRGQIRSSPIGYATATSSFSNTAYRHSNFASVLSLGRGRLVRPLPGFGWGRLLAPPSLRWVGVALGAPFPFASSWLGPLSGFLLWGGFSLPPSPLPVCPPGVVGSGLVENDERNFWELAFALICSSSYFCLL